VELKRLHAVCTAGDWMVSLSRMGLGGNMTIFHICGRLGSRSAKSGSQKDSGVDFFSRNPRRRILQDGMMSSFALVLMPTHDGLLYRWLATGIVLQSMLVALRREAAVSTAGAERARGAQAPSEKINKGCLGQLGEHTPCYHTLALRRKRDGPWLRQGRSTPVASRNLAGFIVGGRIMLQRGFPQATGRGSLRSHRMFGLRLSPLVSQTQ